MKLYEVRPSTRELRVMLEAGFVLREASRLDEAEAIFRGVHELLPGADVPLVGLASVELRRNRFDQARLLCEQAVRLCPDSLYARVHSAEALLMQGKKREAEIELNEIIRRDADSPHSRTARSLLAVSELLSA